MYSFKSDLATLCLMATCCMAYATSAQPADDLENEFECPEHWGFYEDPENCMKYYNCENGVAHSINCRTEQGTQLLYDHHHNYCDWPQRVNCGDRPICDKNNENCHEQGETTTKPETTTNHDDETTENSDFDCPDAWGYYADPTNCIKYYVCQERVPIRMTCQIENGIQLHYNEDKIWCDWPDHVECGSRPICDQNDENCE